MTEREQHAFDAWALDAYRKGAAIQRICQAAAQRYPREASPYHIQAALDRAQRHERAAPATLPASASGRGVVPQVQRSARA